jgi:hypothetical protein
MWECMGGSKTWYRSLSPDMIVTFAPPATAARVYVAMMSSASYEGASTCD